MAIKWRAPPDFSSLLRPCDKSNNEVRLDGKLPDTIEHFLICNVRDYKITGRQSNDLPLFRAWQLKQGSLRWLEGIAF